MRRNIGAVDVLNGYHRIGMVEISKVVKVIDQIVGNPSDRNLARTG